MGAGAVVLVLVVLGVAVAAARELRRAAPDPRGRAAVARDFVVTTLAWPFYLPLVLAGSESAPSSAPGGRRSTRAETARIDRAEADLDETLRALSGVALDALRAELPRLRGLAAGLRPWAERVATLDAELARPECDRAQLDRALAELSARGFGEQDARVVSVRARRASLERLVVLRAHAAEALERALLELEELTTELRVLRFAVEVPGDDALERLRHLAASVAAVRDAVLATRS